MKKLSLTLYAVLLTLLATAVVAAGLAFHFAGDESSHRHHVIRGLAAIVVESLPPADSPRFSEALEHRAESLSLDLMIWDASRQLVAHSTAKPIPFPESTREGLFQVDRMPGLLLELPDGRWFGALFPGEGRRQFFVSLLLFAVVAAIGCYPLARGVTRRLEELAASVQRWGEGALGERSRVEGKDEVARLALSFNSAAKRIEALVDQQRRVLASASHELRSPLSRLRMAVELLPTASAERRQELAHQSETDVQELDELIEDLLLASRADGEAPRSFEPVDFYELLLDEGTRLDIPVRGTPETVRGNARMLRRLLRNLLENAHRYGGREVRAKLESSDEVLTLVVEDRGPGVPPADRQRIFEPFYRPTGHREDRDGGIGLGLALVRQIAEHHHGRAWCEPRDGGGSRFLVELPLVSATPE